MTLAKDSHRPSADLSRYRLMWRETIALSQSTRRCRRRMGQNPQRLCRWHQAEADARASTSIPWAQSVAVFIKSQPPPEYLIEPLIQRASLYTITALTSHGKTAVLLYIALCVASGRAVAGKHTVRGRVVWFAGENPADFAQKLVTACHHWDIDPDDLDMVVMAGAFDLASMPAEAVKMAAAGADTALVVVDTSAAYRFDDDEDSNANAITWARMLREHFPAMPGRPAVLVATHPTKHADDTNLLPRGGGAFLNEVDGNLTLWADEEQNATTLHWQGKFRGMSFSPIQFNLQPCPHPSWTFRNGDPVMVKLAVPTDEPPKPRPANKANGRGRPATTRKQHRPQDPCRPPGHRGQGGARSRRLTRRARSSMAHRVLFTGLC